MWPDLTQKSKEGGLDIIETNIFWDWHEPVREQEAAALSAGDVAYVIQTGQHGGVHFTIAPGPAVAHHPEPHQ